MAYEPVFTLDQVTRERTLLPALRALTEHHRTASPEYRRILGAAGHPPGRRYDAVSELPWLPVGLFKHQTLRSVPPEQVFTVLTSSGTSGSRSRIYLDREAAAAQLRALVATMRTVLGAARLPMLVVDSPTVLARGSTVSARRSGVLGMMTFGRDHQFVLDDREVLDRAAVEGFLRRHAAAPFLIFGFTFMVWLHLRELASELRPELSNGILVHSGGWKRLTDLAVDNGEFRRRLAEETGLHRVYNFYGLVEQMGSVFLEGPSGGWLYCPDFTDVLVRDPVTWQLAPVGCPGVVEVVSTLPRSHPGHVLLTEDLGVVGGVDDGDWPGKRFTVLGRLPRAEPRGCSDAAPGVAG